MSDNDQFYKDILASVQLQKNHKVLHDFLTEQDGNIDLVLTQFVQQLQLHFAALYPDKDLQCNADLFINQNFELLLALLRCIFYGDKNAKLEVDDLNEEIDLFEVTKRQKRINKTVRDLISLSFRPIPTTDI